MCFIVGCMEHTGLDQTCIRLRGVTKEFASGGEVTRAVRGIDLDIRQGEIVALLGPNGAGKTTTIDMILGFTEPTDGSITVFSDSPRSAVQQGHVSAVLQTGGLLRDLKVGESIELVASTYDNPPPMADVVERAGLDGLENRKVQQCSGGEQQRLRFALALLADPDLLILDEPTSGMDVAARQGFWETMRAEAARGRTIVFATHYLQEAEDYAQRIVMVAQGRVIADGSTDQIRNMASDRRVSARFEAAQLDSALASAAALPATVSAEISDDRLVVSTTDSDELARHILVDWQGRDLEIASASLEEAFINLTEADESATNRARS